MNDCVFCKIVKGEIPSYKVYEDDHFLGFLDIAPKSVGHSQLIPKDHHRWVWDVPNLSEYFLAAKKVAEAQRKAFGTDWIASHIIGDMVFHAHIWLVPQDHTKNQHLKGQELADLIRSFIE